MPDLSERWRSFWTLNDADLRYADLARRYGEAHRAYHTLEHIEHCLDELEEARDLAERPEEVELALWLHDAVYDPRARDNEERSADLAKSFAVTRGIDGDRTAGLVLATRHDSEPSTPDSRLVVDIDLSILGQPVERFDKYERGIRQEYAWVPEPRFREVRAKILGGFLARPAIYRVAHFRVKYEARARENLRRSLGDLRG